MANKLDQRNQERKGFKGFYQRNICSKVNEIIVMGIRNRERNVILTLEEGKLFIKSQASDAMSVKVEVTPIYHFLKEFFEQDVRLRTYQEVSEFLYELESDTPVSVVESYVYKRISELDPEDCESIAEAN
jgi:hypothetical protein